MVNIRILVRENEDLIKQIDQAYDDEKSLLLAKANNVIVMFSEFDSTYRESGSTTEKYNALLVAGAQSYVDAAITKITDELAGAGITSSAVVDVSTAKTAEKGSSFLMFYNDLLEYTEIKPAYQGIKFALTDIKVVDGLAAIANEIDLEPLKDIHARAYIDTAVGYDLVEKSEQLVSLLNSINDLLRSNNIYNILDLQDFGDFAKFKHQNDMAVMELEVNYEGIYQHAAKIR